MIKDHFKTSKKFQIVKNLSEIKHMQQKYSNSNSQICDYLFFLLGFHHFVLMCFIFYWLLVGLWSFVPLRPLYF